MSTPSPRPLSAPLSPYGDLGLLPPATRTRIYALVFSSGSVALARTSKALYTDTWVALHRYGVYRVHVSTDPEHWNEAYVPREYLKPIQNVDIRITLPKLLGPYSYRAESQWGSIDEPFRILHRQFQHIEKPKSCRVQFTRPCSEALFDQTLKAIAFLGQFELVDVELVNFPRLIDDSNNYIRLDLFRKGGSRKKPKVTLVQVDRDAYHQST